MGTPKVDVTPLLHGRLHRLDTWNDGVKKYNNVVINVISILVEVGKRDVASSLISKVKPNINCTNLGDWCTVVEKSTNSSVYNAFQVTADNTEDIKTAKQLLL